MTQCIGKHNILVHIIIYTQLTNLTCFGGFQERADLSGNLGLPPDEEEKENCAYVVCEISILCVYRIARLFGGQNF